MGLGGNITYESMGTSYAFRPGKIFVSRQDEPIFDGTDMTRKLFQHAFDVVAGFPQNTPERRRLLRTAVMNLFLDVITASGPAATFCMFLP